MSGKTRYTVLEAMSRKQAVKNIEKWGLQERRLLLLVMLEELGELTQANLEGEERVLDREYNELYDLMSVMYAYWHELENKRSGRTYDKNILQNGE